MSDQIRFTETMRGRLAPARGQAHAEAAREGADAFFVLTVVTPDVDAMAAHPDHRSPAFGCVVLPALDPRPIAVESGHLDLFVDAGPGVVQMRYGLSLRSESGQRYQLRGTKIVSRRRWYPTVLTDTTTLYTDVSDAEGRPLLTGVLWMGPLGVTAQGLSFRGEGGWFGLRGIVRFFRYYVSRVASVYLR